MRKHLLFKIELNGTEAAATGDGGQTQTNSAPEDSAILTAKPTIMPSPTEMQSRTLRTFHNFLFH